MIDLNEAFGFHRGTLKLFKLYNVLGDFSNGLIIVLRENNLKTFDGAVFNPLLSDSMVSVIVKGSKLLRL